MKLPVYIVLQHRWYHKRGQCF